MANVDRLKQVRMAIVNFEENFSYENFFTDRETGEPIWGPYNANITDIFTHNCDTCACIAGFTIALNCGLKNDTTKDESAFDKAQSLLGLSYSEADWLFIPERYNPSDSFCPFDEPISAEGFKYDLDFPGFAKCTQEQGYAEALRRLDHLIEYYSNANSN